MASGRLKINDGTEANLVQAPSINRRERRRLTACERFLYESDTQCCNLSIYGDVSANCEVTSYDAQAASLFMAENPDTGLKPLSQLSTFQRQQMDPTLDYIEPNAACFLSSATVPCVTSYSNF